MEEVKIIAVVKFNKGEALVLNRKIKYKYRKVDNLIIGKDGIFYDCYKYDRPSKGFYAFGGYKFDIELEDGSTEHCYGQWWSGGFDKASKLEGLKFGHAVYNCIEELIKCYVYFGAQVDVNQYNEFRKTYNGPVYEYRDYEKIIMYDIERKKLWKKQFKLERRVKSLVKEVKSKHEQLNIYRTA